MSEGILAFIALVAVMKLFSMKNDRKDPEEERRWREERAKQTFLDYPEEGYGLDDDPVLDELMFLDIMEGDD